MMEVRMKISGGSATVINRYKWSHVVTKKGFSILQRDSAVKNLCEEKA